MCTVNRIHLKYAIDKSVHQAATFQVEHGTNMEKSNQTIKWVIYGKKIWCIQNKKMKKEWFSSLSHTRRYHPLSLSSSSSSSLSPLHLSIDRWVNSVVLDAYFHWYIDVKSIYLLTLYVLHLNGLHFSIYLRLMLCTHASTHTHLFIHSFIYSLHLRYQIHAILT